MKRPIVLVDQDGPLADFDARFWDVVEERGYLADADRHTQTARFATDHLVHEHHKVHVRRTINTTRWFAELPPIEGAAEGMNALAEHAEVWICTKPLEANETCRDDKAGWVREHLGRGWEDRLIIAPDKSLVHGAILLDDAIKLRWLPRATWQPVVFRKGWNREGSVWSHLPSWDWSQPIDQLLELAS